MNIGIDYGRVDGKPAANIDLKTGIRYGVVAVNNLKHWIWDELEPITTPACPHCGNLDIVDDDGDPKTNDDGKVVCSHCENESDEDDVWPETPDYWKLTSATIQATVDRDSTYMMVLKSDTIVRCQFCSPCYPGAGNLDIPMDDGIETYGLPIEYFGND